MAKSTRKNADLVGEDSRVPEMPPHMQEGKTKYTKDAAPVAEDTADMKKDLKIADAPEPIKAGGLDVSNDEPETRVIVCRKSLKGMVYGNKVYDFEKGKKYRIPYDIAVKLFRAGYA